MHKYISTAVFYLGGKIYRNEYTTVVNDMDCLPCRGELSNHFCFYYIGSLIMNHKYIGNEDAGRGNVYFGIGKASYQCQTRHIVLGLYVTDDRRVDHQLTEEEIIFCDQAEKLIYTAMKQLMPTYDDGKWEHLYLVPPRNKLLLQKNSTSPIHASCYATTYMDHVLGVHVDSHNPKIND